MRLGCAMLCDAAVVREGLLHILGGGVTRVTHPSYPARLDLNLALSITFEKAEIDREHQLRIRLGAEDSPGEVAELQARFRTERPEPQTTEASLPLSIGIDLQVERAAAYVMTVSLDDEEIAALPLEAVTGEPPNPFRGPQPPDT